MLFHPAKNLVLVGGRGCGKSSVGRRIKKLNKNFSLFELDALIRYEANGLTIPEIVDQHDWHYFRDLEYKVVEKVSAFESGMLIDAGGGVVVDLDENGNEHFSKRKVDRLKQHSLIVYLQRDTEYLINRIAGDSNRPSLSDTASFNEIMERRDPWYREAADLVFECGDRSKKQIAVELYEWFSKQTNG
ncbi:MAG: shikimate kinase [Motiliproteus sp.]|nr:shikimate kinase [Motiliproteus sp.]MCW9053282.1 shikimate kinase [Motiliproteus sp.]